MANAWLFQSNCIAIEDMQTWLTQSIFGKWSIYPLLNMILNPNLSKWPAQISYSGIGLPSATMDCFLQHSSVFENWPLSWLIYCSFCMKSENIFDLAQTTKNPSVVWSVLSMKPSRSCERWVKSWANMVVCFTKLLRCISYSIVRTYHIKTWWSFYVELDHLGKTKVHFQQLKSVPKWFKQLNQNLTLINGPLILNLQVFRSQHLPSKFLWSNGYKSSSSSVTMWPSTTKPQELGFQD